ncbi:sugar transferase [Spartinivicinus sp. A2-2]|uniref:Sugar transferase n=2 Tax=Spartinivicinus poritis TaxID=2994640 RepID=A0ABT5U7B5_9GAMM|nr:sugar transferase [Spartinivicinus sp. A2-2]
MAFIAIIFLFPILLFIMLVVRIKLGSPIFFQQVRPGLNKASFKLIKFRSMLNKVDDEGYLLPDEKRLTDFGKWLRATSLDELPELWNVLKGDMSIVGPRPLLMEYLPLYSKEQARRHSVKPGITGWAQVNGRNAISWDDKFKLDVWYVDNNSLWLDIKIIFLTIKKVFSRADINQDGEATMSKFTNNN